MPKWFPAWCDFFKQLALARFRRQIRHRIACAARLAATGRPGGESKKIDTVPKEVHKQFVDICLTDFCYPRVQARL
ncbi:MAG: hypothetical protein E5W49_11065 [Mesorhizobium sp.]|uniref:hypothetical protein n=1 Tax=Mesorhizobium sp. TaxID=1871066 RepID=UPI000FE61984|nr:hypothetical protein [Mesorhizobium sp.]RWE64603.1 MAG: hypothetical protein EOS62_28785 [Mesorhizobium sp.]TIU20995.1 MAG: hypothetical protein E5W49_11065 [Mesorhizobium sp.]